MASILMLGLEKDLTAELTRILTEEGHQTETADSLDTAVRRRAADLIFAGGDAPDVRVVGAELARARLCGNARAGT